MSTIIDSVISIPDIFFLIAEHFDEKSWLNMRRVCKFWETGFNMLCKSAAITLATGRPLCKITRDHMEILDHNRQIRKPIINAVVNLGNPKVYLEALKEYIESYEEPLNKLDVFATFAEDHLDWHIANAGHLIDTKAIAELPDETLRLFYSNYQWTVLFKLMKPEEAAEFVNEREFGVSRALAAGVKAWRAYSGDVLACPHTEDHDDFMFEMLHNCTASGINWSEVCPKHKHMMFAMTRFPDVHTGIRVLHEAFRYIKSEAELAALIVAFRHFKAAEHRGFSIRYLGQYYLDQVQIGLLTRFYWVAPDLLNTKHNRRFIRRTNDPQFARLKALI